MIKYLGSKRTLVAEIGALARGMAAATAVDLFTGSTRVAQELKRQGVFVTANDVASYSRVLADCYIATDGVDIDPAELSSAIDHLNRLPGKAGYFTETFCERSRFFQPKNGARIDAIRGAIETDFADTTLYPVLLASLLTAADRVDSTTGMQMAYLKQWAPRSFNELRLEPPTLIEGRGSALTADAADAVQQLPHVDLMYLDPPYNQHRYFTNYHIWETLVRWDSPDHYGVACKRVDSRDDSTKSVFNRKREMPRALAELFRDARAEVLLVSYNNEAWISADQMRQALQAAGHEQISQLAFDRKRYVGAQIGGFNPNGVRVSDVTHTRNIEYLFLAGPSERVSAAVAAAGERQLSSAST